MNTLNDLVTFNPMPVINTDNFVSKETFDAFVSCANEKNEELQERLDKAKNASVNKKEGGTGKQLRLNRPLEWHFNWSGDKKYATLGKERLEYWHHDYKTWYPVDTNDGAPCSMRYPDYWDN